MRIKTVQAWWVRIPIEAARQHRSDFGQVTTFDAAILRIETDDGLVGWGEGKNAAGSAGSYGALVHMLNHEVGPQLIGRTPCVSFYCGKNYSWRKIFDGLSSTTSCSPMSKRATANVDVQMSSDGAGSNRF